MPRNCFIIQPFDRSDFDKRYKEVFCPIIQSNGFEPYRVDEDSAASIPIIEIESQIEKADMCFADITTDNPNVWCEVGLAIAHKKELCLVCARERGKLPFDVQHRQVIFYDKAAPSDFADVQELVGKRLQAITKKLTNVEELPATILQTERTQSELSNFEIAVMGVLASELAMDVDSISVHDLRLAVDRQGYTSMAANIAIRMLMHKDFVEAFQATDRDYEYSALRLRNAGWDWIIDNMKMFNVKKPAEALGRGGRLMNDVIDDNIPF